MKKVLTIMMLLLMPLMTIMAQTQLITETFTDQKLESVFQTIQKKTGVKFVYNATTVKNAGRVTAKADKEPVAAFLNRILKQKNLEAVWQDGVFVVKSPRGKMLHVYGRVTDYNGEALPGVTISVRGTHVHAITDAEGNYHITASEQDVIRFSSIGMKTRLVVCNQAEINVKLEEDEALVQDVVVTGYQNIDRSKLTSSVTTLKMEDINNPGLTTIDKMLEGRVPGMMFMQNSGQVGATPKLRVRGTSTLIGNREPVWVLDGIVLSDPVNVDPNNLNDPDFVNLLGNAISGLNPNDIEEINVLKDASATALYGAKAGNGVIVITTKKGKVGKPSVTYNGTVTLTQRPRYSDRDVYMMTSQERIDVAKELVDRGMYYPNITQWSGYEQALQDYYAGKIDFNEYHRLTNYYGNMNTDWFKLLTKDSFSHNHTVSLSGGTPNIRYYASLGYGREDGVIKGEKNDRYNATINLNANYGKLTANFQLLANYSNHDYLASSIDVMNYAYNMSRTMPAYADNGDLFYYPIMNSTQQIYDYNILNELANSGNSQLTNNANLRAQLRYQALPYLNFEGLFAYGISNTTQEEYYTKDTYYVFQLRNDFAERNDRCPVGGQLKREDTRLNDYMVRFQANFNKNFGEYQQHLVTASAGIELSSKEYKTFGITRRGYFTEYGGYFDPVPTTYTAYYNQFMSSSEGLGKRTRALTNELSYYATAGYGYKDTYIFNVHMRAERSNLFGTRANDEFSPIWSLSGRWNMKKDVLRDVKWVDDAALRASWGYQGNMLPGQTAQMIIRQSTLTSNIFNSSYANIVNYPNPDLKWEKTSSYNVGLDFALLGNKIRGTLSYFYKHTTDAFLTKKISEINGITQYVVNGGTLDNQGVEVSLSFTPINQANIGGGKRGFVWRIDPQIGEVINKVVNRAINNKTNVLRDELTYNDFLSGNLDVAGKPVGTFYSYKFKELDHNTGAPIFYGCESDKQDEYKEKYANMTREEVFMEVMSESGCREPYIQGGISNYLGYRNFSMNFNFTYSLGNKIRLMKICSGYATTTANPQQNLRKEFVNRWRKPGDEAFTTIPGLTTVAASNYDMWWNNYPASAYSFAGNVYDMYDYSDLRVVSGDYLKLQTLSFSYNFEEKLLKALGIQSAYVSIVGNNLFTICSSKLKGQDPTQSGSAPSINLSTRPSYTLNLNITF